MQFTASTQPLANETVHQLPIVIQDYTLFSKVTCLYTDIYKYRIKYINVLREVIQMSLIIKQVIFIEMS